MKRKVESMKTEVNTHTTPIHNKLMSKISNFSILCLVLILFGCNHTPENKIEQAENPKLSSKPKVELALVKEVPSEIKCPKGMVWVSGGVFNQGAISNDEMAMNYEKPRNKVAVDGFFMDTTEVTNAQFSEFINSTRYVTLAERPVDWEEMKNQVPVGTPRPADSLLQPGSLVFRQTKSTVSNLRDYSQWWHWTLGANWKHPEGPNSSIEGRENYPVVHLAYEDVQAYCKWIGHRLPTEAEWEYASRGKKKNEVFFWGNDGSQVQKMANTWTGLFPVQNDLSDGYLRQAPVGQYPANSFGLYDMSGNVWEWTSDWYNTNYYKELSVKKEVVMNPKGPTKTHNPLNPYVKEKVIKGGSFLCSNSYCGNYRSSAKMGSTLDSSTDHIGFRTVVDIKMLNSKK